MNIITVTVSTAMMGVMMPGVMTMAIAPTIAQVRSNNFGVAESQAVTFADEAAISYELPDLPDIPSFPSIYGQATAKKQNTGRDIRRRVSLPLFTALWTNR